MRDWLHGLLSGDVTLSALLPGGVGAFQATQDIPEDKPFLRHRLGVSASLVKDDNVTKLVSTPAQIWVHDRPGDYMAIDAALQRCRTLVEGALGTVTNKLYRAEWLEVSEDLNDPQMGTILKYARIRIIHKP